MHTEILRNTLRSFESAGRTIASASVGVLLVSALAAAQCPVITSELQLPTGIVQSNARNLLIAESGTAAPNSGRISTIDLGGNRRTLLDGLPSGISDVGSPNGPSGLFMRGRTLYVAVGTGDVGRAGPLPGSDIPNPNPPSSPIFSSVLTLHFSADAEKTTTGFRLTFADQVALADDQKLTLLDGTGNEMTIERVAQFPYYLPKPLPAFAANIGLSNPFALVAVADQLYVTDGGQNRVWQVDIASGSFETLAQFPGIVNPLFPAIGGPFEEAVPTGITYSGGRLLVTLFSGIPFSPGTSLVKEIDLTGNQNVFITGLKTAIGILPISEQEDSGYLVLENASTGPFFGGPGVLLRFSSPIGPPTVVANCLMRPTAMTLDPKNHTVYITDLAGRLLTVPLIP